MNQVSLQICLFKWAPYKHWLSEWMSLPTVTTHLMSGVTGTACLHGNTYWWDTAPVWLCSPFLLKLLISLRILVQCLPGPRIRNHPHSVTVLALCEGWGFLGFFFFFVFTLSPNFLPHHLTIIYFWFFWQLPLTSSNNILKLLFPGLSTLDRIHSFLWTTKKFVHSPTFPPPFFCPPFNSC